MRTLTFLGLSMLTLSLGLAADHPITISGGTPLTISHERWKAIDKHNVGSNLPPDHVHRVVVQGDTDTGHQAWKSDFQPGERLDLSLTYGTVQLTVAANHIAGQDIVVTTNKSFPDDFQQNGNDFVRNETGAKVTNVTVKKNNNGLNIPPFSGHADITICYGTPDNKSPVECQ